jgi:hypothetical protein
MGVAPTGKRISMTGISIFKISEGKVAENRAVPDVLGMMRQIGAIPEPGQSEEVSLTYPAGAAGYLLCVPPTFVMTGTFGAEARVWCKADLTFNMRASFSIALVLPLVRATVLLLG